LSKVFYPILVAEGQNVHRLIALHNNNGQPKKTLHGSHAWGKLQRQ
jgi:hypothetical protein